MGSVSRKSFGVLQDDVLLCKLRKYALTKSTLVKIMLIRLDYLPEIIRACALTLARLQILNLKHYVLHLETKT